MKKIFTYDFLERNGRLGNQLWQIAWQIGQAHRHNGGVFINPQWSYRQYFSIPEKYFQPERGKKIDGLTLYYQELHHWAEVAEEVWAAFQPTNAVIEHLHSLYDFLDRPLHKTSIHCRRGDYLQYPTKFPIPTDAYYDRAIEMALEENPDTLFLVFSDDFDYIKQRFVGSNFIHIEGTPTPVEVVDRTVPNDQWDLFLMSRCQQNIIANSTFSWWGAYLGKYNKVYYPDTWFGPDLDARDSRGLDVRDSWVDGMPSDWIKVAC